jgi:hypothetical protein
MRIIWRDGKGRTAPVCYHEVRGLGTILQPRSHQCFRSIDAFGIAGEAMILMRSPSHGCLGYRQGPDT